MPVVSFVLPLANAQDPYTVFGPLWDLSEPWRLVPGRDYEPSPFSGLALCHPWEAMQHAAGNAFASPIPPARQGSPMNSTFLLGLLEELRAIEPSIRWHFQLPQGWFKNIGDFAIGENFGPDAVVAYNKEYDRLRDEAVAARLAEQAAPVEAEEEMIAKTIGMTTDT